MLSFFVTATDTDVGKTFVSSGLAREFAKTGKRVGYLKPFQSGLIDGELTDAQTVEKFCGGGSIVVKSSYMTKTPCAPSLSAEIDGVKVELEKVKKDYDELARCTDILIVEGSGGLLVPVSDDAMISDVIKMLDIPTIVISRPALGTVNHTLVTLKCLDDLNIQVLGVVISNYDSATLSPAEQNAKKLIEKHAKHKVLAQILKNETDFSPLALELSRRLEVAAPRAL
jgi:dethiobiotin synthetase